MDYRNETVNQLLHLEHKVREIGYETHDLRYLIEAERIRKYAFFYFKQGKLEYEIEGYLEGII